MKNLKDITLIISLLLVGTFSACKKDDTAGPGEENEQLINSAQLFFNNNNSVSAEGNDAVAATYADNTLKVNFSQNNIVVALEIPNYDINSGQSEYNNATAALRVKIAETEFNSAFIFIPVIVGNPPVPVFVTDKTMTIKTTNLKVDDNTTDIAIQITNGSQIISVPFPAGTGAAYSTVAFNQGDGGKPNMINIRIKQ